MQENKSSILYKTEKLSKKAIGMRFKELRNEKGISQQSMAKILNVSRSNYSQIELGNQYPTFETLAIISDYCGRSYEWILHGEGNESFTPNITITEQTGNIEVSFPKVDIKDKRTVTVWASQIEEYIQKSADPSYIKGLPGFEIPRSVSEDQDTVFRAFSVGEDILTLGVRKKDMIIAKPLSNYSEVIFNHTFVIVTTSSIVICRILDFVSASKIFICNDGNPNMQQSLIALSEIKEIWMATGIYSASSGPIASKISEQLVKFQIVLNNLQDEILQLKKALNN